MALPVRGGGPVSDSAFSRRNISLRQTPHCLGAVRVRIFPQTQGTDHLLATCTQRGYAEGRGSASGMGSFESELLLPIVDVKGGKQVSSRLNQGDTIHERRFPSVSK